MPQLNDMFLHGTAHAWLFVPSAIVLGALHGLEPGHSKTMMAAFIVAVRGTVAQAVMLGIAAALSHTAVVWVVALIGLHYAGQFNAETAEPYFQIASAVLIIAIALWMLSRSLADIRAAHDHDHHDHHHHGEIDHDHGHGHASNEYQDAHERAHAQDIADKFGGRPVTNGQIVLFGLTGGLIPCPASITVLLLCLQLKQFTMGAVLVAGFSLCLAITMVSVGAAAALSVNHVSKRWSGFSTFARQAPYFSSFLIICVGLYTGYLGWSQIRIAPS